jgi:thiamine transporter
MDEGKKSNVETFVRSHLWLFAAILGLLVFIAMAGPFLISKGGTYGGWDDDAYSAIFTKTNGTRLNIMIGGMFSPVVVWPLLVEFGLVLLGILFSFLGKLNKNYSFVAMFFYMIGGILFLVNVSFYDFVEAAAGVPSGATGDYADVLDYYYPAYAAVAGTKLAFGSIYGATMSFIAAAVAFGSASSRETYSVRDLAEIGVLVAAAIGLHYVKIPVNVQGGSINLAPIPLFVLALRHGPIKGFFAAGIIYGLIACVLGGYGFVTYPLDYLVAYGGFAVLGFFRKLIYTNDEKGWSGWGFLYIFLGVVAGTFIRFVGSSASSMINYGLSFRAALVYNVLYISITGLIALVAMEALYVPLAKLERHFPVHQSLAE